MRFARTVDELDRGWDSSEDARAFVAGLFQACISVNSLHDNLRVYMSLRRELYEEIPELYEDAQKYRDLIETIHWNSASLLKLIANRIRHSLPALADHGDQACWDTLFSPASSGGSFRYMIDRTLHRPREIIQFCTLALECAHDSRATVPLRRAAVREAEYPYSRERSRDIAAEYRFQYPGLLSILEAFRGKSSVFSRDDIELLCLELITRELPTHGTHSWLDACAPDALVEILWNTGFLRAEARQDISRRRQIPSTISYLGPHQASHQTVVAAQHFQIHPMFWAYLGSRVPAARVPHA